MSRIDNRFAELKAAGRKALIPYVTAGDPNPVVTVPLMHAMVKAGSDIIELGVPFSDPMADGPEASVGPGIAQHVVRDRVTARVFQLVGTTRSGVGNHVVGHPVEERRDVFREGDEAEVTNLQGGGGRAEQVLSGDELQLVCILPR